MPVHTMQLCPWDKGQCPHGALSHAVPGCCKCFQQCRIAGTARLGTLVSYPTLLETLATPWDSVEQCSVGTLSLVQVAKLHRLNGPMYSEGQKNCSYRGAGGHILWLGEVRRSSPSFVNLSVPR